MTAPLVPRVWAASEDTIKAAGGTFKAASFSPHVRAEHVERLESALRAADALAAECAPITADDVYGCQVCGLESPDGDEHSDDCEYDEYVRKRAEVGK